MSVQGRSSFKRNNSFLTVWIVKINLYSFSMGLSRNLSHNSDGLVAKDEVTAIFNGVVKELAPSNLSHTTDSMVAKDEQLRLFSMGLPRSLPPATRPISLTVRLLGASSPTTPPKIAATVNP